MKNGTLEKNKTFVNYRHKGSTSKLLTGKTSDKYPVVFDGGKTIIYISDKSKEAETRKRYELHRNLLFSEKSHS